MNGQPVFVLFGGDTCSTKFSHHCGNAVCLFMTHVTNAANSSRTVRKDGNRRQRLSRITDRIHVDVNPVQLFAMHDRPILANDDIAAHPSQRVNELQITIMLVAALTMAGLMQLVNRTRLGRAMRATAENGLGAARASRKVAVFESNVVDLSPGTVFSVDHHPRADVASTPLLVTELLVEGEKQGEYVASTLGPYDYWAIEYAYKPIDPAQEKQELAKIASRSNEPQLAFERLRAPAAVQGDHAADVLGREGLGGERPPRQVRDAVLRAIVDHGVVGTLNEVVAILNGRNRDDAACFHNLP